MKRKPIKVESVPTRGGTMVVETYSYTLEEYIERNKDLPREEAIRRYYMQQEEGTLL